MGCIVINKIFYLLFAILGVCSSSVLIADNSMSRMVELTTRPPYCVFYSERGKIQDMLLSSDPRKVRQMSDESITQLEEICKSKEVKSSYQGGFIYPGTKWCGPGDVAANFSDLGYHSREDMCCRTHDNCPNNLSRGECRLGICNDSPFTRSHCDCDAAFRRCLQNVNTEAANTIGAIFFNVVQVICFKERSPCSPQQSPDLLFDNSIGAVCPIEFSRSERYVPTRTGFSLWRNPKEFIVNKFKKNGYSQAESDVICSQWKYRPSEKYIPLMPFY